MSQNTLVALYKPMFTNIQNNKWCTQTSNYSSVFTEICLHPVSASAGRSLAPKTSDQQRVSAYNRHTRQKQCSKPGADSYNFLRQT